VFEAPKFPFVIIFFIFFIFYHGNLGMKGKLARWRHNRGCMRCVGYLLDRIHQALNKNARVKLYIKRNFAFVLVGSSCTCLPMGPRSIVRVSGLLYAAPWLFLFIFCKRLMDNKYSRMFKEF
jgi:hypothetical protein